MGKTQISKRLNRLERNAAPEVKRNQDESGAFDTVGSINGTLILPQVLGQGTGRSARIGDKLKSRNLRFQGIFKMPQNPANSTCAIRILVLRAKMSDPTTADMPTWYASVDEDKFVVLKDVLTQVSAVQARTVTGTSFQTGSTLKKIKFNVSLGLRNLQYDGSAAQSPLNNETCIFMFAENQSAEVAYNWQHYYLDN